MNVILVDVWGGEILGFYYKVITVVQYDKLKINTL